MDDLIAFLTARLDEDEAAARPVADRYAEWKLRPRDWTRLMCDPVIGPFGGQSPRRDIARGLYVGDMSDPDRILREMAAKRAILAQWEASPVGSPVLTFALYHLAAVYSDHPDYDPAWAPATASAPG